MIFTFLWHADTYNLLVTDTVYVVNIQYRYMKIEDPQNPWKFEPYKITHPIIQYVYATMDIYL